MFDMFLNSVTLFLRGKLFKDAGKAGRQVLIGIGITALLCIGLAMLGVSLPVAVALAALLGGSIQPWLFKDLKYA